MSEFNDRLLKEYQAMNDSLTGELFVLELENRTLRDENEAMSALGLELVQLIDGQARSIEALKAAVAELQKAVKEMR